MIVHLGEQEPQSEAVVSFRAMVTFFFHGPVLEHSLKFEQLFYDDILIDLPF